MLAVLLGSVGLAVTGWAHPALAQLAAGAMPGEPPQALAAPPPPKASGQDSAVALPQLAQLHRRLLDLKAGRVKRLTILQIGDSHTASDHFSGRLRELFQVRFGNAGRGMMPPGSPFPYWRPYQARAEQSGKWQVFTSNKPGFEPLPYGLSGHIIRGSEPTDIITLEGGVPFDSAEIGYYQQAEGGKLDVLADGLPVGEIDTKGTPYALTRQAFTFPSPKRRLEVRPHGNGPVDIGDWAVYRNARGIVLTSHGFSGAQISIMDRWDTKTVATQIGELDPALIILAFGTNEGYAPSDRVQDYAGRLERRIAMLKKAAPNASIVLVAGPDANRLPKYCTSAATTKSKGDKSKEDKSISDKGSSEKGVSEKDIAEKGGSDQAERKPCKPLSAEEVAGYDVLLSRSDRVLCRWHTPGSYDQVRRAQKAAALKTGAYFWDWFEFQGGYCGAYAWEQQGLVHKDRVHMTREGYWRSANQLYKLLVRGLRER